MGRARRIEPRREQRALEPLVVKRDQRPPIPIPLPDRPRAHLPRRRGRLAHRHRPRHPAQPPPPSPSAPTAPRPPQTQRTPRETRRTPEVRMDLQRLPPHGPPARKPQNVLVRRTMHDGGRAGRHRWLRRHRARRPQPTPARGAPIDAGPPKPGPVTRRTPIRFPIRTNQSRIIRCNAPRPPPRTTVQTTGLPSIFSGFDRPECSVGTSFTSAITAATTPPPSPAPSASA